MNYPHLSPRTQGSPALPGSGALPYSNPPSLAAFEIERTSKQLAVPSRRNIVSTADGQYLDEEFVFRDSISRVIAAKIHPFTVSGRIPFDPSSLTLFFRSKGGATHSLDFPIDADDTPPALNVLKAACKPRPISSSSNFDEFAVATESLVYPPSLPLTTTLEISNHPIMNAVRSFLFPTLHAGHYLTVLRDKLDVIPTGQRTSLKQLSLQGDGRVATINITLPARFRGGALVIRDQTGSEEKYSGRGGKSGDMEWVAYRSDCTYEVEPVQKGCKLTLSYGVYMRTFGPGTSHPEPLITPSANFLDLFSPILNTMRGRIIAWYLIHDYDVDPSSVLADSLVPDLKGGDSLLYHALKVYNLVPELRWTAGGYVWPVDKPVDCGSDATFIQHNLAAASAATPSVRGIFAGSSPSIGIGPHPAVGIGPVIGASGAAHGSVHGYADVEAENMRLRVEGSGAIPLSQAEIVVLADWEAPGSVSAGKERAPFVSAKGELEKLVVNVLLVTYVP